MMETTELRVEIITKLFDKLITQVVNFAITDAETAMLVCELFCIKEAVVAKLNNKGGEC